jgi:hypothetical protein
VAAWPVAGWQHLFRAQASGTWAAEPETFNLLGINNLDGSLRRIR